MKKFFLGLLACAASLAFTSCNEPRAKEHGKEGVSSKESKIEQPSKKNSGDEKKVEQKAS